MSKIVSMMVWGLIALFLSNYAVCLSSSNWQPNWLPERDDLHCDGFICNNCLQESPDCKYSTFDKCCTCNSYSELAMSHKKDLVIEYVSTLGKTLAIPKKPFNTSEVYRIIYTYGFMSEIPSNLCDWDDDEMIDHIIETTEIANISNLWNNIISITFSYNKIKSLPIIGCLSRLDELYLDNNQIQHISNKSLAGLQYLRNVDLKHNHIHHMDPSVLFARDVNFFNFDLSYNNLTNLDVSNMMGTNQFCTYSFNSNKISELTNILDAVLDQTKTYGPGFVSLANNAFVTFPDLKGLLHLDSLAELGKFIESGFDLRLSSLHCDCFVQEFVDMAEAVIKNLFYDYMNVTCASPEELKGKFVINVTQEKLICNEVPYCPNGCTCVDMPSKHTLHINCSGLDLTDLPPTLPESSTSRYTHLDVSFNRIGKVDALPYLSRLHVLNISYNNAPLLIDESAVLKLPNDSIVDISNNNNLQILPRSLQYLNRCNFNLSNLYINCGCQNLWLTVWFDRDCGNSDPNNTLTCILDDDRQIPAYRFKRDTLRCEDDPSLIFVFVLMTLLFVLIASGSLFFLFRYEFLILYLRLRRVKANCVLPEYEYDAFVSFDEENDSLRNWVYNQLVISLEELGYKLFLPFRDLMPGEVRNDVVIKTIKQCRNFLLVLSESCLLQEDSMWTENEWKYGWHKFTTNSLNNIVLVNFDHVTSFDVHQPQLKAFIRVGSTVDFLNQNGDIIQQIVTRLGPCKKTQTQHNGLDNKRRQFDNSKLFQVLSPDALGVQEVSLKKRVIMQNDDSNNETLKLEWIQNDEVNSLSEIPAKALESKQMFLIDDGTSLDSGFGQSDKSSFTSRSETY